MSYRSVYQQSALNEIVSGSVLISLELDSRLSPSEFPETVIALRDSRKKIMVKDYIMSKYQNALYVYLPSVLLNNNRKSTSLLIEMAQHLR